MKHIIVETETDALLLENSLIKEYKPRYNVLLKDDKTYPDMSSKSPKIFYTRNNKNKNAEFFGPYTSETFENTFSFNKRNLSFLES